MISANYGLSAKLMNSMCNITAISASQPTMNSPASASASSVLQDQFEFNKAFDASQDSENTPILVSPADDLFYKGQLLPLFLPSRIKMVQELSSPIKHRQIDPEPPTPKPITITKLHHHNTISPISQDLHIIEEDVDYPHHANDGYDDQNEVKDYTSVKDLIDRCYDDTDLDNTADQASSPLLYNGSREDPSLFPDCYRDPATMMASSTASSFCNIYSHHGNLSKNGDNNNNIGGVAAKYAARWKAVLFRRGKKCSAILEATCCHYTRTGSCTNRDMVPSTNQADVKLLSSNRSSLSCKAVSAPAPALASSTLTSSSSTSSTRSSTSVESSVAPRDSLSTTRTSSASCVSTSSVVSSHCGVPRTSSKAGRKEISTRSAHKDRLVSKAKDCLQKSLRVLRLKRLSQKGNQRTSFLIRKSNGAAIHSENILNKLDESFIRQDQSMMMMDAAINNVHNAMVTEALHDVKNGTKRECFHHQQQHDMDIIRHGGRDQCSDAEDDGHDDDDMVDTDNESQCSDAGFITIDPSATIFYRNNPSISSRPYQCTGSRSSSFSSSDIELDINPIKGAIAHCKRSSQKSGLSHRG